MEYTATALIGFREFWSADLSFSVTLLGQFLEDLEAYVEVDYFLRDCCFMVDVIRLSCYGSEKIFSPLRTCSEFSYFPYSVTRKF